jgi:hypothetical protein
MKELQEMNVGLHIMLALSSPPFLRLGNRHFLQFSAQLADIWPIRAGAKSVGTLMATTGNFLSWYTSVLRKFGPTDWTMQTTQIFLGFSD